PAALLRAAFSRGRGGRDLLRAAVGGERARLGRAHARRLRLRREGVRRAHAASARARPSGPGPPARAPAGAASQAERVRKPAAGGGARRALAALSRRARAAPRRGEARLPPLPDAEVVHALARERGLPGAGAGEAPRRADRGRVPRGQVDGGGAARAHARLPPPRRLRVRVGRRAAGDARERAAGGGADLRRARGGPLPRPQRGGVGQARRRHGGAVRVCLSRRRAARVAAEDPPPRRPDAPGPRAEEQLPPPLRRAEREGPGRPAGRSLLTLARISHQSPTASAKGAPSRGVLGPRSSTYCLV